MSHYGNRGRGRGAHGSANRQGLLGSAPRSIPGLLDTTYEPVHYDRESRSKQGLLGDEPTRYDRESRNTHGLLGNAPGDYSEQNYGGHEEEQYSQGHESDYSYQEQKQYDDRGYNKRSQEGEEMGGYNDPPKREGSGGHMPSQILHSLQMHGITEEDLAELTHIPQKDITASDLLRLIKNVQNRRAASQQSHDRGALTSQQGHSMRSFSSRERSPDRNELYDPSEPTDDYGNIEQYKKPIYSSNERQTEAFSNFEEKWYSEGSKKNERESQSGGSILRGSRGPVAKSSRWERDDQPPTKQLRRASPPRRVSPIQQRRPSPVPVRRPSPLPRRLSSLTPPPRRLASPPRRMSPPPLMHHNQQGHMRRGGSLLGPPPDPPMQNRDMLQTTGRPAQQNTYRSERGFNEPDRFQEPMRRSPPRIHSPPPRPLMPANPVLQAQMQAVQYLQSEVTHRPGPPPLMGTMETRGKPVKKTIFTKEEAMAEADKMRQAQGRVLYLRYQARGMGVIREEHLVKLAQPFEKVTNVLLVAPANLKTGWYQAFLELAHFDGAAAMCEHYMHRPPTVEGIAMQVQRSKHQNLKLRDHQMNRDIDKLVQNQQRLFNKRKRDPTPERAKKSPKKGKKPLVKGRKDPQKGSPPKPADKSKDKTPSKATEKTKDVDSKAPEDVDSKSSKDANSQDKSTKKENNVTTTESVKSSNGLSETASIKVEKEKLNEVKAKIESETEVNVQKPEDSPLPDLKTKKNIERLNIIGDNLEQATTMAESLLEIVKEESTQAIISEILEYLGDSVAQLEQIEAK